MLTLEDYFMGRDKTYAADLTSQIKSNAVHTVMLANLFLSEFYAATPLAHVRKVNSGWRPPAVNSAVPNAATKSKHMVGTAVDLGDDDGQLDAWCMSPAGMEAMERLGLWLEHPDSTPRWCHLQTVPPGSGRRIFHP